VGYAGAGGAFTFGTSDGGAGWSYSRRTYPAAFRAIVFRDRWHGWIVGYSFDARGVIYFTSDGGASWTRQEPGKIPQLYAVAFPDAIHGWAVGKAGTIVATSDGGGGLGPAGLGHDG